MESITSSKGRIWIALTSETLGSDTRDSFVFDGDDATWLRPTLNVQNSPGMSPCTRPDVAG